VARRFLIKNTSVPATPRPARPAGCTRRCGDQRPQRLRFLCRNRGARGPIAFNKAKGSVPVRADFDMS
jgi:hypothetical protein